MEARGVLYLCGTPLGNLEDVTLRVLRVLREVDLIAAEDTRRTRKLLARYGVHTPLTSFHEHNQAEKIPRLLALLGEGKNLALVSDAGMPGLADPGYFLVREALDRGLRVTVVPGPSAVVAALVVSGFRPYPFYFQGFLPRARKERRELLEGLREERRTGVFYEAPHRLQETLAEFREVWGSERRVAVVRELTKRHEEVVRGTFAEVAEHFARSTPRGELTLVTEGRGDEEEAWERELPDREKIKAAVEALVAAGAPRAAALKGVARALGVSKSEVYRAYEQARRGN